jgi:hypothetical protein
VPTKRKTKASTAIANDTEGMSIEEAFGRGRAKPATASDDEGNNSDTADLPDFTQNNSEDAGDSMDVS